MTMRERIAAHIVKVEGRFDKQGRLQVYRLPKGDDGGTYEVAGINDKYHRAEAHALRALIQAGKHKQAEKRAGEYIMRYTDAVKGWWPPHKLRRPDIELLLRDIFFNRGNRGAAATLQIALGVHIDGRVGKITKAAFAATLKTRVDALPKKLTAARATYERTKYPWKKRARNEKSPLWKGLRNRWNNTYKAAIALL